MPLIKSIMFYFFSVNNYDMVINLILIKIINNFKIISIKIENLNKLFKLLIEPNLIML